jgi:PAS domain S-box-containing protein
VSAVFDLARAAPGDSGNDVLESVLAAVRCVAWRVPLADLSTSYVSANAERVLGHAATAWNRYESWLERVHPADRARVVAESDAALADRDSFEREYRIVGTDGAVVWVHDTVAVLRDATGAPEELHGLTVDVTERLQLQREVLAAGQREKESLAHALHEGLAQQLTGIAMLAGALRDDGERRGSPVAASLRRLAGLLQEAVGTCRRLAQGVSGFVVRHGGLQIGLRELALAYERRTGAVCDVDVDQAASDAMDPERARHLYWIAEDALHACCEPGEATDAALRLDRANDRVRLRVRIAGPRLGRLDFPESPARKIIGYRAGLLGAALVAMPVQEGGIIIEVLCPLEDGTGVMP